MKFKRITKMLTNEQLFRIFIKNGFSKGDVTVFDTYAASDFVENQYGFTPANAEGVKIERVNKKFTFDKPKRGSRKPKRVGNIKSLT
jgi:hypothetical protein